MTYASYFGSPTGTATEARVGSAPQSFMMYDIAALQALYGANFSKAGTSAVYRWDAVTGQETINGMVAPNTGVTATNKIFSTVWTQGARAIYDLSNFVDNQVADLRPGRWSTSRRPSSPTSTATPLPGRRNSRRWATSTSPALQRQHALTGEQHHHRQRQRQDHRQRRQQQDQRRRGRRCHRR